MYLNHLVACILCELALGERERGEELCGARVSVGVLQVEGYGWAVAVSVSVCIFVFLMV